MSKYKKTNIIADICKFMGIDDLECEQVMAFKNMKCIELLALKMKLVKELKLESFESADPCDFAQWAGCSRI